MVEFVISCINTILFLIHLTIQQTTIDNLSWCLYAFLSGRVTENTTLFYYEFPNSYSTMNDPSFIPVFPSPDDLYSREAVEACGDNQLCLFDYRVTGGDVIFAQQTMQSGQIYQTIIQNTQPGKLSFIIKGL